MFCGFGVHECREEFMFGVGDRELKNTCLMFSELSEVLGKRIVSSCVSCRPMSCVISCASGL